MKTILITGGTGLLGTRLSYWLNSLGYDVRHLSRRENLSAKYPAYFWNPETGEIDLAAFDGLDGIVHLAGANLADKRWTSKVKKKLIDSRVESTKLLSKTLEKISKKPTVFVACSAVGFYGDCAAEILTEQSPKGTDFLSEICVKWENSTATIRQQAIRTPIIRVGVVLSSAGGAFEQMKKSYPMRVGAYFGDGQQFYPWIHIDDICRIFIRALEDPSMNAIYNACAPEPTTNYELAKAISTAYQQKTLLFPVPRFALNLLMGEMSSIILNSTRAVPKALLDLGFEFEFQFADKALKNLLQNNI